MRHSRLDLDGLLDTTRAERTDRLDVLFAGPRLVEAPPENLFIAPGTDGESFLWLQHGYDFTSLGSLRSMAEPLRSWLDRVIPHRAADDEDGAE